MVGTICLAVVAICSKMLRAVESASAFSFLTNIENEINASSSLMFTEPYQYFSSESYMADTYINPISFSVKH